MAMTEYNVRQPYNDIIGINGETGNFQKLNKQDQTPKLCITGVTIAIHYAYCLMTIPAQLY